MRKSLVLPVLVLATLALGAGLFNRVITMGKQPDGTFLVPSGQTLTPVGKSVELPFARPKDLAVSPDQTQAAILATDGVHIFGRDGKSIKHVPFGAGAIGVAWSPDQKFLYATQSDGKVALIGRDPVEGWKRLKSLNVDLPGSTGNPHATGLAVSQNGRYLYTALSIRNAVTRVDLTTEVVDGHAKVDVAPYQIALHPGNGMLYVSCRGGKIQSEDTNSTAKTSTAIIKTDPKTDAAFSGTVCLVESDNLTSQSIEASRQPGAMLISDDRLFVANEDADSISEFQISGKTLTNRRDHPLAIEKNGLFGAIPTSISQHDQTLTVTLGGLNAVAQIDIRKGFKLQGVFPTAWFPIAAGYLGDRLVVANAKGIGGRAPSPESHFTGRGLRPKDDVFYTHNNVGTIQFVEPRDRSDLNRLTRLVAKNNNTAQELAPRPNQKPVPVPERVGEPSVFKRVVFIIKENLTYDSVLGDLEKGNGDPSLCMFPDFVSPNHHDLSRQFVTLDNLYTSGTNSADGHQWTTQGIANGYSERNYSAYARSYPYDGGDALAYSPEGFIWNAALNKGKTVRVFGEFVDRPIVRHRETGKSGTFKEIWDDYKKGTNLFEIRAETSQDALRPHLNTRYIGFPSIVSDQYRADVFLDDLTEWEKTGQMPDLSVLLLPNDHTMGTSPSVPTPWAAVADNDLALGRIVDRITRSQFWKDTLIIVVEDDCQLGIDHVDGHRTFGLAISPYTRHGAVVSEVYTHPSILRTIGLVLGLPAMNRFDQTADPMTLCFTEKPDFTPYTHRVSRIALDNLNEPPSALSGEAKRWAEASANLDWTDVDRADATTVAHAVWTFARPNEPFPYEHFSVNPMVDDDDD